MGGRSVANHAPYFPIPLLLGACHIPFQYKPHRLQSGHVMGWILHNRLRVHHTHADLSAP